MHASLQLLTTSTADTTILQTKLSKHNISPPRKQLQSIKISNNLRSKALDRFSPADVSNLNVTLVDLATTTWTSRYKLEICPPHVS